jgi:hypothetical protein
MSKISSEILHNGIFNSSGLGNITGACKIGDKLIVSSKKGSYTLATYQISGMNLVGPTLLNLFRGTDISFITSYGENVIAIKNNSFDIYLINLKNMTTSLLKIKVNGNCESFETYLRNAVLENNISTHTPTCHLMGIIFNAGYADFYVQTCSKSKKPMLYIIRGNYDSETMLFSHQFTTKAFCNIYNHLKLVKVKKCYRLAAIVDGVSYNPISNTASIIVTYGDRGKCGIILSVNYYSASANIGAAFFTSYNAADKLIIIDNKPRCITWIDSNMNIILTNNKTCKHNSITTDFSVVGV